MAQKRVTTLELNITSKTAKTFFADLRRMAKDTRQDIADLQQKLAQTKSELAGGKRITTTGGLRILLSARRA